MNNNNNNNNNNDFIPVYPERWLFIRQSAGGAVQLLKKYVNLYFSKLVSR